MRKNEYSPQPVSKNISTDLIRDLKATMWDNYVPFIIEDDFRLLDHNVSLSDTLGNNIKLKDLAPNKYKIIVRYSSTDCDICVDSVMNMISGLKDKKNLDNVYAITDSRDERDFIIRTSSKKYPVPVYRLSESTLGLFMENKNFPFVFVLTPDFHVVKVFMPSKEVPLHIRAYLSKVLNYLDANN
nr:hypothetical protein [Pedobacter panaciterrae]